VADATGTTVWRWDQVEPFGNNPADEDPDANSVAFDLPLRLPGQRYDAETALHYNYYRDYDPSLGRYGRSDPAGLIDGPSTYSYVRSSPIAHLDVLGLTSYVGFGPQQELEMKAAVEEAKKKIENCSDCKTICRPTCYPDEELKKDLIGMLDRATFVYKPGLTSFGRPVCGYVGPIDFWRNRADISDSAFGPRCCPLASTLAHEAYHLLGYLDPEPYKLEDVCFGCPHYPK
jgi:RHS repeat-associated protein